MSTDDMHEIFKRHFESRFMPLDGSITLQSRQESEPEAEEDVSSESEWEGLSDREDAEAPAVEVVEHTSNSTVSSSLTMSKRELKAFMVLPFVAHSA